MPLVSSPPVCCRGRHRSRTEGRKGKNGHGAGLHSLAGLGASEKDALWGSGIGRGTRVAAGEGGGQRRIGGRRRGKQESAIGESRRGRGHSILFLLLPAIRRYEERLERMGYSVWK
jgi:hypothetical protein